MPDVQGAGSGKLNEASPVRVFISYAHDDRVHEDRVRDFWSFLRAQGIEAYLDLPAAERRQDWTEWMTRQVRDAEHVLVVASPEYRRRAEGDAGPGEGRGVQWEARLIRDRFYADQEAGLQEIVPVVLPGCSADDIPLWMAPAATTHCLVSEYTVAGAEWLLRFLTGQPWETEPPLGVHPVLPQRRPSAGEDPARPEDAPERLVRLMPRPVYLAGRDELLENLRTRLTASDGGGPQGVVLTGLAGIGKTSAVAEYAHRHLADYGLVWQLPSSEPTMLMAAFAQLADQLDGRRTGDASDSVARVHSVLAGREGEWLLIFDDAPDPEAIWAFLPPVGRGHVLITSQHAHWPAAMVIEVPVLELGVAAAFLAGRAAGPDHAAAMDLAEELGGLPLALEQAASYMQATGRSIAGYLALFRHRRAELLSRGVPAGYDKRVATVWTLAFEELQDTDPGAIGLLRLLSFCAPDEIPMDLLLRPVAGRMKPWLRREIKPLITLLEDPIAADDAITSLRRFSLISYRREGSVSVHRLVQAVTLDQLPAQSAQSWLIAAIGLIAYAVPDDSSLPGSWPSFAALLPHALTVIPSGNLVLPKFSSYLHASGSYKAACLLQAQIVAAMKSRHGAEHPDTLIACLNLATFIGAAGDAAEALDQLTHLVPACDRVLGPQAPGSVAARSQLASLTGMAGDPAGARDLLTSVLPALEATLGAENPQILVHRNNLAGWIGNAGDTSAARDQFAALVPVMGRVLGAEHPVTLAARGNLAMFTGLAGDLAGARDQLSGLIPVRERALGAEHPDVLTDRANLWLYTGMAGEPAAARDQLTPLVQVRDRVLGAEHPHTLTSRLSLALMVGLAGDPAAARDQLTALLPVCQRVLGTEHLETLDGQANLAYFTGISGDAGAGRDQLRALLPVCARILGPEDPRVLAYRARLASLTGRAGDAAQARDQFAALVPVYERMHGHWHQQTQTAMVNLWHWTNLAPD